MAFLASHRAAGHISGECLSVDGGMEGRLIWKENEVVKTSEPSGQTSSGSLQSIPRSMPKPPKNKIRVAISIDLDAVSGWLGTGKNPYIFHVLFNPMISGGIVNIEQWIRILSRERSLRLLCRLLRGPSWRSSFGEHAQEGQHRQPSDLVHPWPLRRKLPERGTAGD